MDLDKKIKLEFPEHWWNSHALESAKKFLDDLPIKLVHSGRDNDTSQIYASHQIFRGSGNIILPTIIFDVSYGRIIVENLGNIGQAGYSARQIIDDRGEERSGPSTLEISKEGVSEFVTLYISNYKR